MSISLSQRSAPTAANPTRQQLDELDALLQRMMALPVNKLENVEAAPAPANEPPPVSYTTPDETEDAPAAPPKIDFQALKQRLEAMPELMRELTAKAAPAPEPESPASDDEGNWVPLSSTWQPSALTWKPLAQSWQKPPEPPPLENLPAVDEPAAEEPPAPAFQLPPTATTAHVLQTEPAALAPQSSEEPPIASWATPLIWFNNGFDFCLSPLGPVDRLLRTRTGRLALAIVGLGCLAATGAILLMDWIGWPS